MNHKVKAAPRNGVQCPACKKRLFSFHTHDFKLCGCPNKMMVDGGGSYLRYGGKEMPKVIKWSVKLDGPYERKN